MKARTVVGVIIAPLIILPVIITCFILVPGLTAWGSESWTLPYRLREGVGVGIVATGVGYVVTVLGALPAHLRFVRRGWKSWWMYGLLGALLGIAPWLIYGWTDLLFYYPNWFWVKPMAVLTSLGFVCGVTTALLFWLIVIKSTSSQARSFTEAPLTRTTK